GMRIGTAAITSRGMKVEHMEPIVDMIDEVLSDFENESVITDVRNRVNKLMAGFDLY
ncbi:MAG: glycine hydroxymethyltransferase, partial [Sphingobacteriales bacterium]